MGKIFEDNSLSIGNTPLIRLNTITKGTKATVLVRDRRTQSGLFG